MKQVSLRIPDAFHSEVSAYAESVGVSLNQLALIALRDYLDSRRPAVVAPTAAASSFVNDDTFLDDDADFPVSRSSPRKKKPRKPKPIRR